MIFYHLLTEHLAHDNACSVHRKDQRYILQALPAESAQQFVRYLLKKRVLYHTI